MARRAPPAGSRAAAGRRACACARSTRSATRADVHACLIEAFAGSDERVAPFDEWRPWLPGRPVLRPGAGVRRRGRRRGRRDRPVLERGLREGPRRTAGVPRPRAGRGAASGGLRRVRPARRRRGPAQGRRRQPDRGGAPLPSGSGWTSCAATRSTRAAEPPSIGAAGAAAGRRARRTRRPSSIAPTSIDAAAAAAARRVPAHARERRGDERREGVVVEAGDGDVAGDVEPEVGTRHVRAVGERVREREDGGRPVAAGERAAGRAPAVGRREAAAHACERRRGRGGRWAPVASTRMRRCPASCRWSMTRRIPASAAKRTAPAGAGSGAPTATVGAARTTGSQRGEPGSTGSATSPSTRWSERLSASAISASGVAAGVGEQHVASVAAQAALQLRGELLVPEVLEAAADHADEARSSPRGGRARSDPTGTRSGPPRRARGPRSPSRRVGRGAHTTLRPGTGPSRPPGREGSRACVWSSDPPQCC